MKKKPQLATVTRITERPLKDRVSDLERREKIYIFVAVIALLTFGVIYWSCMIG